MIRIIAAIASLELVTVACAQQDASGEFITPGTAGASPNVDETRAQPSNEV